MTDPRQLERLTELRELVERAVAGGPANVSAEDGYRMRYLARVCEAAERRKGGK